MSFDNLLTYKGKTLKLSEWVVQLGLKYSTVQARLDRGWTVEKAFMKPCKSKIPKTSPENPKLEEGDEDNHRTTIFDTEGGDYGKY